MQSVSLHTSKPPSLTPRELNVCSLVVQGYTNKEISQALGISERTVETHRANVFRKLNVRNAAELQHDYSYLFV
ncbi:HTH-type transcriptional regulator MalT [Oligella urethralis]|uniref:Nitrogen regulation protein C n=1 Tax=Oligella urethralis TaxID=90245 RepID=A0A2N6QIN3_9BURK|nr:MULTISPECIES: helix-turn-helix transcriptional regulator [Oligella]AVL70111.1 LuxR family transcriptional regulator [Oligella urethralis]MDK6202342.1 helix-turn-helix transcriptional regulator [Oligella urethralis]OFS84053.1 helix-turn-helix transcriptional regulator [Oligella sp. HMSC05A10]PMC19403.1 LuxR family transcriptional regulator [Oligella urethralis]WOS36633.1 HTH-type transcriptional regulator MalT [Oligella urethralis]